MTDFRSCLFCEKMSLKQKIINNACIQAGNKPFFDIVLIDFSRSVSYNNKDIMETVCAALPAFKFAAAVSDCKNRV